MSKHYTNSEIDTAIAGKADKDAFGSLAYIDDAPSDSKQYARKDGEWAEVTGGGGGGSAAWGDITGTLSDQTDLQSALDARNNLYYTSQAVSAASSAQIMRIPSSGTDSAITADTIVMSCIFADQANLTSDVSWQSYDGYVIFTGTCPAATTANVILSRKGN